MAHRPRLRLLPRPDTQPPLVRAGGGLRQGFAALRHANFRYYLNYVWLCSEPGDKWRNTLSHGAGLLLHTVGKTVVGFPLQVCSRLWLKGNRTVRVS